LRVVRAVIALVSVVVVGASDARAQPSEPSQADAPEPAAPEPSAPEPPAEMPAPRTESRSDAAWTLYHDAFEAARRDRQRARREVLHGHDRVAASDCREPACLHALACRAAVLRTYDGASLVLEARGNRRLR
jgi:hypothetical protein